MGEDGVDDVFCAITYALPPAIQHANCLPAHPQRIQNPKHDSLRIADFSMSGIQNSVAEFWQQTHGVHSQTRVGGRRDIVVVVVATDVAEGVVDEFVGVLSWVGAVEPIRGDAVRGLGSEAEEFEGSGARLRGRQDELSRGGAGEVLEAYGG